MDPWRLVGRAILVGLDALAAATVGGVLTWLTFPVLLAGDRLVIALTAAGAAAGVTLAVALALAGRGRRPFPATRAARAVFGRLP